jgi:hypothetical protein
VLDGLLLTGGCLRSLQGHFQIVLSVEHCPLFQKELPVLMRIMYCFGVWSYVVGAITAPVFIAIPLVTIWAGVFPIVVSWWAAGVCAQTLYLTLYLTLYSLTLMSITAFI